MAAELEAATGIKARLIEGGQGIFIVTIDGRVVFDKWQRGKVPQVGEVLRLWSDGVK